MSKPHVHAELIKAWADGAVIEQRPSGNSIHPWKVVDNPAWTDFWLTRIKPEPVSSMTSGEAYAVYIQACQGLPYDGAVSYKQCMRAIADEAVRRYVEENTK